MADEEEVIPDEVEDQEIWVLMRDLPLHTSRARLLNRFETVDNVRFLNRKDKVTYTRSCLLQLESLDEAASILEEPCYYFNDLTVSIERYNGDELHRDVFEKGKYKLIIRNVRLLDKDNEELQDTEVYKYLEGLLHRCSFTDMLLRRGSDKKFNGVAEVRFRTEGGRTEAKELIQQMNLGWKANNAKKKKKKRKKKLNREDSI